MKPVDVLVIGRSCVDYIAVVDRYPEEDTKMPLETRIREGGGQGSTAACCIAKLGGNVAYLGKVGDDDAGRFCLKRLADFQVPLDGVRICHGVRTPVAYIFVSKSTGTRTIVYERSKLPRFQGQDIAEDMISRARVVLLDPETTYLAHRFQSGKGRDVTIVYDAERWRDGMEPMMARADYFIPSQDFLYDDRVGTGSLSFWDRIKRLQKQIKGVLVVTCGSEGAIYLDERTRPWRVMAARVRVRDTTGAGDNFHAAFALAVSRGQGLADAVRFSVAVASLSCEAYGGRSGVPDWETARQVASELNTYPIDEREKT